MIYLSHGGNMRRIIILIILSLIISISSYGDDKSIYKDISNQHWAYRSIVSLNEKGILQNDDEIFNGDKSINRYEFAYYLSKTLNRLDSDKANRADLLILEHIVYEFSEELTKFGFNSNMFIKRINKLEKDLAQVKKDSGENKKNLIDLDTRLKKIEKESEKRATFLSNIFGENETESYLNNINLYLDSSVLYFSKAPTDRYKGEYDLGIAFRQPNFEVFLESKNSDITGEDGEIMVKGQLEKKIFDDYYISFHTKDYERFVFSRFNHVIYDNHNSFKYEEKVLNPDGTVESKVYQNDRFDSYGISFRNKNIGLYLEKTDMANDKTDVTNFEAVTVDSAYADTMNFIAQVDYDFFEGTYLKNGNNNNQDYELSFKYPVKGFEIIGGFSQKRGRNRKITGVNYNDETGNVIPKYDDYYFDKISYYNGEVRFGTKLNLIIGAEYALEEKEIYKNHYASLDYKLTETGLIKYKYENVNTDAKTYGNHYVILKVKGEKVKTYLSFSKIGVNKRYLVSYNGANNLIDEAKDYRETTIKTTYDFNEKVSAKFGYVLTSFKNSNTNNKIAFIQGTYKINPNTQIYLKYTENDLADLSDRRLDINNDKIDLDFDESTGVIRKSIEGLIEIGVKIEI